MEAFDPFDLVVVPFPFTDRKTEKRRPAIVLSSREFQEDSAHVILAMVTSAQRSSRKSDVTLTDWKECGLPHPSVVRAKIFTLDERFILRKLGTLTERDKKKCLLSLTSLFPGFG